MFRFPGSKSRLYPKLEPFLLERFQPHLIIPFSGAGNETIRLIKKKKLKSLWMNDLDCGITSFWKAVYFYPLKFLHKIKKYEPCVDDFYKFKSALESLDSPPKGVEDVTDIALTKLAIHQISYSGLGVMAGGPIGGKAQTSKYNVACRWNPQKISKRIIDVHNLLKEIGDVRITTWDFEAVLSDKKCAGLVYLDPPYFEQGPQLYQHSFTASDHWRLSEALFNSSHNWVLSYDDHPTIRQFYSFAKIHEVDASYSITGQRKKNELIITC